MLLCVFAHLPICKQKRIVGPSCPSVCLLVFFIERTWTKFDSFPRTRGSRSSSLIPKYTLHAWLQVPLSFSFQCSQVRFLLSSFSYQGSLFCVLVRKRKWCTPDAHRHLLNGNKTVRTLRALTPYQASYCRCIRKCLFYPTIYFLSIHSTRLTSTSIHLTQAKGI